MTTLRRPLVTLAVLAVAWSAALPVSAAEIELKPLGKKRAGLGPIEISIAGPIEIGDADRLAGLIRQARETGRRLVGIDLDSPGGVLAEAVRMSQMIRNENLATILVSDTTCASACVLLFAAGNRRQVYRGARVGVHSAAVNGAETGDAALGTLIMARQAKALGIPDIVIGKMVTTTSAGMQWLTRDELVELAGPTGFLIEAYYRP